MPEAIMNHNVCVLSGLIYVIGGNRNLGSDVSSVRRFDPAMDVWSTVKSMLGPRVGLVTFVRGGSIYAAGGLEGANVLSSVERHDVASDSWEGVSDMALTTARYNFGAHVMTLESSLFESLESKAQRARD
jgi:N-acetylneuraminic acid mutarotase